MLNARSRTAAHRTLFNMAVLVLTVQAAGQVYQRLGGTTGGDLRLMAIPLAGMALTYFLVNTVPIAIAIALATQQSVWRIWKSEFASSAPSYLLGAAAAAVVIAVTERSGYWLTLLLTAAPLYLTYKMYRAGRESEARQGAILEAAHDAIITMDAQLNIREFNPAAEQMFGRRRTDVLGRSSGHARSGRRSIDSTGRSHAVHGDGRRPALGPAPRADGDSRRRRRISGRTDGRAGCAATAARSSPDSSATSPSGARSKSSSGNRRSSKRSGGLPAGSRTTSTTF